MTDVVLEVGPGKGSLTRRVASRVGRVVAVEKGRELVRQLTGGGPQHAMPANVQVIEGDALELDWHHAVRFDALPGSARYKVAGNIPYYITSPLIDKALTP